MRYGSLSVETSCPAERRRPVSAAMRAGVGDEAVDERDVRAVAAGIRRRTDACASLRDETLRSARPAAAA